MPNRIPVNLLLIDDDDNYAGYVAQALGESKYFNYAITRCVTVDKAKNELTGGKEYDVILLDLKLPNGEGPELVKQIRSLAPKEKTAIIALAEQPSDEDKEMQTRRYLVWDFIVKGELTPEQFRQRVRNAVYYILGYKEADPVMAGMQRLKRKIDETVQTVTPYP